VTIDRLRRECYPATTLMLPQQQPLPVPQGTTAAEIAFLGAIAFSLAWFLLGIGNGDQLSSEMTVRPEYKMWVFLLSLQASICAISALPLWRAFLEVRNNRSLKKVVIYMLAFLVLFSLVGMQLFDARDLYRHRNVPSPLPGWPPCHAHLKMEALVALALAGTGIPAFLGMNLVQSSLREMNPNIAALAVFLQLRRRLALFIGLPAFFIGLSTLSCGAWRKLVIATDPDMAQSFPGDMIVIFGLFWTVFLAIGYGSVHVSLLATGQKIRDLLAPLPSDSRLPAQWYKERKAAEELLGLRITSPENLKAIASVLTPVVSGFISVLRG
jgi:hypothetical protein